MKKNIFIRFKYWVLARYARKIILRHAPIIIGIIGSDADRKLTKKAIHQVVADKFGQDVLANADSLGGAQDAFATILKFEANYFWPFMLISAYFRTYMKSYPKYLILELGEGRMLTLKKFTNITKIDMLIVSDNISVEANLTALTNMLKKDGKIFAKFDPAFSDQVGEKAVISVSISDPKADYFATNFSTSSEGTIYRVLTRGQNIAIKSKTSKESDLFSQLFAFAVGHQFNIQTLKIKKSLEKTLDQS